MSYVVCLLPLQSVLEELQDVQEGVLGFLGCHHPCLSSLAWGRLGK